MGARDRREGDWVRERGREAKEGGGASRVSAVVEERFLPASLSRPSQRWSQPAYGWIRCLPPSLPDPPARNPADPSDPRKVRGSFTSANSSTWNSRRVLSYGAGDIDIALLSSVARVECSPTPQHHIHAIRHPLNDSASSIY